MERQPDSSFLPIPLEQLGSLDPPPPHSELNIHNPSTSPGSFTGFTTPDIRRSDQATTALEDYILSLDTEGPSDSEIDMHEHDSDQDGIVNFDAEGNIVPERTNRRPEPLGASQTPRSEGVLHNLLANSTMMAQPQIRAPSPLRNPRPLLAIPEDVSHTVEIPMESDPTSPLPSTHTGTKQKSKPRPKRSDPNLLRKTKVDRLIQKKKSPKSKTSANEVARDLSHLGAASLPLPDLQARTRPFVSPPPRPTPTRTPSMTSTNPNHGPPGAPNFTINDLQSLLQQEPPWVANLEHRIKTNNRREVDQKLSDVVTFLATRVDNLGRALGLSNSNNSANVSAQVRHCFGDNPALPRLDNNSLYNQPLPNYEREPREQHPPLDENMIAQAVSNTLRDENQHAAQVIIYDHPEIGNPRPTQDQLQQERAQLLRILQYYYPAVRNHHIKYITRFANWERVPRPIKIEFYDQHIAMSICAAGYADRDSNKIGYSLTEPQRQNNGEVREIIEHQTCPKNGRAPPGKHYIATGVRGVLKARLVNTRDQQQPRGQPQPQTASRGRSAPPPTARGPTNNPEPWNITLDNRQTNQNDSARPRNQTRGRPPTRVNSRRMPRQSATPPALGRGSGRPPPATNSTWSSSARGRLTARVTPTTNTLTRPTPPSAPNRSPTPTLESQDTIILDGLSPGPATNIRTTSQSPNDPRPALEFRVQTREVERKKLHEHIQTCRKAL